MKKTLLCAVLTAAMAVPSLADYTWNGGETITDSAWQDADSWILPEGASFSGSGPGVSMYGDVISISDAKGSISQLEGWNLKLALTNAELTVGNLKKFQGNYNAQIDIDENSILTISNYESANGNRYLDLNNEGTFNITLGGNFTTNFMGCNLNLGTTGIVNASGAYGFMVNSLTATLPEEVATLQGTDYTLITRQLVTLGEGTTLTGNQTITITANGFEEVDSLDQLAAGKYYIDKSATGISLIYGQAIPEPATATLSLLALAGLAARRRRK